MSIQPVRTISYNSNSNILSREDLLFLEAAKKQKSYNQQQKCECPNILCCDDDHYQHMVLRKFLKHEEASEFNEAKCKFCFSGEDLIKIYMELRANCSCGGPRFIISDYNMGERCMDGVALILKLRELGFSGVAVLRTSENLESLQDDYEEVVDYIESKQISFYLSKNDILHQKNFFKFLLEKND